MKQIPPVKLKKHLLYPKGGGGLEGGGRLIDEALAIGVLIVGGTVLILLVIGIIKLITHGLDLPFKRERYETGNVPKGRAKKWFDVQYYGYLIVFLAFEPILIFLFFLPTASSPLELLLLVSLSLAVYIPTMIFGMRQIKNVSAWTFRRGEEG